MALTVRLASSDDLGRWNGFLAEHPQVPPFCDFRWHGVVQSVFGVTPQFLMATDAAGAVEGVLPVYITKSLRGRRRLYSLNRGLVANSATSEAALVDWLQRHWQALSLSSATISSAAAPGNSDADITNKAAVVLALDENTEDTWKKLRSKTRNMIRKAEKAELVAERGFHNLRPFYEIYAERMLSMGVAIYGYDLFQAMAQYFGSDAELIVARLDRQIVAGIMLIHGVGTSAYPFQATKTAHLATAATQFLIWQAVTSATERGIRRIDMGESQPQSPVYMSKVNFGGVPEKAYYLTLSPSRDDDEAKPRRSAPRSAPRPAAKPSALGRTIDVAMNTSPMWVRRPLGLWLKRQGRLLF